MWLVYLVMFIFTVLISYLWVRGIDNVIKHKKEHPEWDEKQGWLDWDESSSHTENEI